MSRVAKLVKRLTNKLGYFGGFEILKKPFSYPQYLEGEKLVRSNVANIQKKITDLKQLSSLYKKSRKDPFFKHRLANTSGFGSSWMDSKKRYWVDTEKKAFTDVTLDTLNDVLGRRKKLTKTLLETPDSPDNFMKRFDAKYELKKLNELASKAKGHFRRFGRSTPSERPFKELKNMSKSSFGEMVSPLEVKLKEQGIVKDYTYQSNRIEWGRRNPGKTIRDLKKLRREYVKEVASELPKPKRSLIDYKINKRAEGVVFRRIGGRVVPIRVKK